MPIHIRIQKAVNNLLLYLYLEKELIFKAKALLYADVNLFSTLKSFSLFNLIQRNASH